jgi:competence ComEA-like helix-hairpin-helix protein
MNEQRTEEQHDVPKVDLNTATVEELTQLLRIGLKMARRIIEYRETVRPFEEPEDLMAVSGIGGETYRRLADRLTVSSATQPPAEEGKPRPTLEEVEERIRTMQADINAVSTALLRTPPDEEEGPPVEGEEPLSPTDLKPPVKEERAEAAEPPPKEPPPPRQVPPEARPPAVAPPPAPSAWRGGFTWLAAASLIGAVDGLRERLDALEGLTGRLEDVERDIEDLDSGLAEAQADIVALDVRADALGKDIATVRAAADRFSSSSRAHHRHPHRRPHQRPRLGQPARRVPRLHQVSEEGLSWL